MSVMPAPTDANPSPSFGGPVRIPIEADTGGTSNKNDHFIPGIGADPSTSGSSAHLGLFYYSYRVAACQGYNNALPEAMYAPTCGLAIGISPTLRPVTRPPSSRIPVIPARRYRTAH